jgi:hypothetical protein
MSLVILTWLTGCLQAPITDMDDTVDDSILHRVIPVIDPMPFIDLEMTLRDKIPLQSDCPNIQVLDGIEIWEGDCELFPGHRLEGEIRFEQDGEMSESIIADDFRYLVNDQTQLSLSGQMYFWTYDSLLRMESILSFCGMHNDQCHTEPYYADTIVSVYPIDSQEHDITLSGMLYFDDATTIDGTWHIDPETCPTEATNGLLAIQHTTRHDIVMDGSVACDGCSDWSNQGSSVGTYCGITP